MGARRRFVVDADLAEADPGGEALEETIALGKLAQRRRGARRQQAEVAGIFGDFLPRAPIDQCVEAAHGITTFSAGRLIGLSIEGLTSFSVAPLRFASLLGVVLATIAFLFGLSIMWETFTTGRSVPGYPSLVVGLMTIGGVQLIMIGIVGEYIGKILSELKARPIYFVAEHSDKRAEAKESTSAGERTAAE